MQMQDLRARLYASYVSSGQAIGATSSHAEPVGAGARAYYRRIIRRHLPVDRNVRIVDLACGHGALIHCLKECGYLDVRGCDLSPQQVELAHSLGVKEVELMEMRQALKSSAQGFDVAFLMDVLEHLYKKELLDVLDDVHAGLVSGGTVVIHVPNAEGLHGMRIRYGDLTHELCFTQESIRQALQICGFSGIRCFEEKPVVRNLSSLIRRVLWDGLTLPARLRLLAETGVSGHILSQNLLVTARK